MTDLRTSLHRAADAVEPLPVDDDLWQRGVAARRRGQAFVVAAVLAILVSVTWSAVLLGDEDREARTASTPFDDGAIPRSIVDPGELELELDLALGRASAAFVSAADDLVVVTATDGVPHALGLPAWDPTKPALALSADGRFLAYQQVADEGAQIAVLDLESGLRSVLLAQGGDRLKIDTIRWSPGGEWLGWAASRIGTTPSYAGRIRPDGSDAWRVEPDFNALYAAVADDGTLALGNVSGDVFLQSGEGRLERVPTASVVAPWAFSPDSTQVALASAPSTASYTLDLDGRRVLEHPFPEGTLDEAVVRPVGWVDDRLELLYVEEANGGTGADSGELVVTTPEVDGTSTWRRSVGVVEAGPAASLSLAVDLIPDLDGSSSQPLTYDFPPPPERDISWIIGLGVAAAIAVLMALRWLWRRLTGT